MKQFVRVGLILATLLALSAGLKAQPTNLLTDPSFEATGNYNVILASTEEGTVFGVPAAWDGWILTTPRTETWMNLVPDGYPHTGLFKFDGGRSLSISRGFATFTTAVYQRVTVEAGTNLRGSARGFMERGSTPPPGAQFRVGIDPTGGENPLNPAVVWSPWVASPNSWVQATVDATASGSAVTLFLYSTQSSPSNPNAIYWDDARLETGGGGSAAASGTPGSANVLPTPAFAPFVAPQGVREDGSIIHIVVTGDTLDAIAVAYRTTRDEILRLNDMTSRNFLQLGQEIIVRPPTAQQTPDGDSTPETSASGTGTIATSSGATVAALATGTQASGTLSSTARPDTTGTPSVSLSTMTAEGDQSVTTGTIAADIQPTEAMQEASPTPTETSTPEPTSTDLPPAPVTEVAQVPSTEQDVTALCAWMFDDVNQNRIQEGSERALAGGTVEIRQGSDIVESFSTDDSDDPTCFLDIAPGDYSAVATAPDGYGLTTATVLNLRVQENARTNVRFGAAEGATNLIPPPATEVAQVIATPVPAPIQDEAAPTSLLQMSGLLLVGLAGVVILGGIGLALFIRGR